jgi:hypothetical protein
MWYGTVMWYMCILCIQSGKPDGIFGVRAVESLDKRREGFKEGGGV